MEQPAIVGIMARVWMWVAWLVASFGAYSELIGYRWQWNPHFLVMMVIVGYMAATRKDAAVLETAIGRREPGACRAVLSCRRVGSVAARPSGRT
jgi:hypothetical protein